MFPNGGANRTFARPHDTCQSLRYGRLCLDNSQEKIKKRPANAGQNHFKPFTALFQ